jgi:monoamine oxidase
MDSIIILGAGLSGLTAAYFLKQKGINCTILEAQNQPGGRIQTIFGKNGTPMEMGATWFGKKHTHLLGLLHKEEIAYFPQHDEGLALFESFSFEPPQQYFVPKGEESALRIKNGSIQLINFLAEKINRETIKTNTSILSIEDRGTHLLLKAEDGSTFTCRQLILTVPPRVAAKQITFLPEIPGSLKQVMENTQTWMGGSIKFAVEYANPFWRKKGFSGSVFSQSGPVVEMYDHCSDDVTTFSLKGFLGGNAAFHTQEERRKLVLAQLTKYFGEEAGNPVGYYDKIWSDPYISFPEETFLPPHHYNGHGVYAQSYMAGKLFFAGTETSPVHGGYMEGAIFSAIRVVNSNCGRHPSADL